LEKHFDGVSVIEAGFQEAGPGKFGLAPQKG
jgi:hypothetical protein